VRGDTITIDAMGCRRDRAAKIGEQEADEALPVKENQPTLYREINVEEDWGRNPPTGLPQATGCAGGK
jgi:predicted transposase YbfD/YdcC